MKLSKRALILSGAVFLTGCNQTASEAPENLYVSYDITDFVRTETDDREVRTSIYLAGVEYVGYRYDEIIAGATTPLVRSVSFYNEYKVQPTAQDSKALLEALRQAGVFTLKEDPDLNYKRPHANLDVSTGAEEISVSFATSPIDPRHAKIQRILLDFATRMKIDKPENMAQATTISEGDLQPARQVELKEILAHPDDYNGKRVAVVGYYHGEFEGETFCSQKADAENGGYDRCVWYGEPSSFAKATDLTGRNKSWQRIEGVFFKGPGGHMELWPGEIRRLTRTETVAAP